MSILVLLAALSFTACQDADRTPEGSLRAFLESVKVQNGRQAWASLSKGTKDTLRAEAAAIAEAAGEKPSKDPADLLFRRLDLMLLRKPQTISIASPLGGDEVRLLITVEGGKSANMRMVREGSRWKVDLLGSLENAPAFRPATNTATAGDPEAG